MKRRAALNVFILTGGSESGGGGRGEQGGDTEGDRNGEMRDRKKERKKETERREKYLRLGHSFTSKNKVPERQQRQFVEKVCSKDTFSFF